MLGVGPAPPLHSSTLGLCGSFGSLRSRRGAPGGPKRSEMLTRVDPSLDRAVVLFQDVIQVWHRPVPTAFVQKRLQL
jgi:hypothetical protein